MTTPKDKFKPSELPSPALPESEEEWSPRFIRCGTSEFRDRMLREPHLFEPSESPSPALPESEEEWSPGVKCGTPGLRDLRPEPHLFEPLPSTDWLARLGIGSAVVAFLMWAVPACLVGELGCLTDPEFFSFHRLPAVAAFLALSFILLLRRR